MGSVGLGFINFHYIKFTSLKEGENEKRFGSIKKKLGEGERDDF